jgi:homoserine/homoserine lactone efflux protein
MSLKLWLAYALILFLFSITPGPAVILASSRGAARGFASGMAVVVGIMLGNMLYMALSAVGLGAILLRSEPLFLTIKYAGAAYLIFMGVQTLRSAWRGDETHAARHRLWSQPIWQGVSNQLANPKAILFYTAILPQFVDAGSSSFAATVLILMATEWLVEVPVLAAYVALAANARRLAFRTPSKAPQIASGLALVGVGVSVAWSGDARRG